MSRSHTIASSEFDITDVNSSIALLSNVYYEIARLTKHTPGCLPAINGGMPRMSTNLKKKQGWVGCPGVTFFGISSHEPLLLGQYLDIMELERHNALMPVPMHPIPIVPSGDLSLLGVTRSTVVLNEKSLEEFHNDFIAIKELATNWR